MNSGGNMRLNLIDEAIFCSSIMWREAYAGEDQVFHVSFLWE